jgi:hypothetical protein
VVVCRGWAMANYLRGVLSSLLSKYVSAKEELKLNLWQGRVELRDVELNVAELPLPVAFARATIKSLSVVVPWTRLMSQSVVLAGTGLFFEIASFEEEKKLPSLPVRAQVPEQPQDEEVAQILRQVKRRLRIELSDVLFVIRGSIRVQAKKMLCGPFGAVDGDDEVTVGESEEYSIRLQVVELSVLVEEVVVLHPVSAELVLSFNGSHLSYCNVVVTQELQLSLSDVQIELLQTAVSEIFAANRKVSERPDSLLVVSPIRPESVTPPPPLPDEKSDFTTSPRSPAPEEYEQKKDVSSPRSAASWTSSIWSYGMSWVSSAASAPSLSPGSPLKRINTRPASSGNLLALEAAAASAFLPSWFRFELPLFRMELSRHVRMAVGETVHVASRPLLQLSLQRNVVEWSHSPLALELIARIGAVSVLSLWEKVAEGVPCLLFDSFETDAVSMDWVHRSHDRFVNVTVEPFVFCASSALIRETSLFVAGALKSDVKEDEIDVNVVNEEKSPSLNIAVNVSVMQPRICFGEFDVSFEMVRFSGSSISFENVSIANRVTQRVLLVPIQKLIVETGPKVVVQSEGVVSLRIQAEELRGFIVTVERFIADVGDSLPDYGGLGGGGFVLKEKKKEGGRPLEIVVSRACLHIDDLDGNAVADALLDVLVLKVADGVILGSVAGIVLLDRSDGKVLVSTFATDGTAEGLSTQAYALMVSNLSLAADLIFSSPLYKHSTSSSPPVSFCYSSHRESLDYIPVVTSYARVSGLYLHFHRSAFARLGKALHLGKSGLDAVCEARLTAFSAARLKVFFFLVCLFVVTCFMFCCSFSSKVAFCCSKSMSSHATSCAL